ncbi:replication-associated protein [Capybara virus 33_cap3_6684]|uniref:Replication-associated protein n=1 Tax=Capybara virus 33_cap3_6684 TaxID=2585062 RepID=A0A514TRZ5_9VIRU|nr:replication-associated protein [Capybara virus 33_cap3_6684]
MAGHRRQGVYWIITLPERGWGLQRPLPEPVRYITGQLEQGESTGYRHWQCCVHLYRKGSIRQLQAIFGEDGHYELSRSSQAEAYCNKEATPFRRNEPRDWDAVWESAKQGDLESIPADIRVRSFGQLSRISTRYAKGVAQERRIVVLWGRTGTGKSRRAWDEATLDAYPKDPRTKWWDGYTGQDNVVIDEFRGGVDIAHVLRWFDRYPVLVETKGGAVPLRATTIWITSNLSPRAWYPTLDEETYEALERRLEVTHFE